MPFCFISSQATANEQIISISVFIVSLTTTVYKNRSSVHLITRIKNFNIVWCSRLKLYILVVFVQVLLLITCCTKVIWIHKKKFVNGFNGLKVCKKEIKHRCVSILRHRKANSQSINSAKGWSNKNETIKFWNKLIHRVDFII